MKKVIVLIDGQNLFYTLKEMGLQERQIKWDEFLQFLINNNTDELVRTYWFRAQKLSDSYYTTDNIKRDFIWKNHRPHFENFKQKRFNLIPQNIITQMDQYCAETEKWINNARKKFNNLEYIYDKLSCDYEDIEIVKKGVIKISPYKKDYIGEKGVDIALAVKMIALSVEKKCDKIILVSGDYDYAEAIQFVKNNMTKIHIVKLHKGVPPKNLNMSRDLSVLADKIINIYEEDIRKNFLKQECISEMESSASTSDETESSTISELGGQYSI